MADIIKILRGFEDFDSLNGTSEDEILLAESELKLSFASDYKAYLLELGIASADGHEFTGIVKSPRLNVVDVTVKLKKRFAEVPKDAYVLEEIGIDDIVIFQTTDGSIYKATPKTSYIKIANSFADYLNQ